MYDKIDDVIEIIKVDLLSDLVVCLGASYVKQQFLNVITSGNTQYYDLSHNTHLNRHQTILQTFINFFLNLTLPGVPHLYKQLPNGQYLSDLCKMCNLDANE